MAYEDYEQDQEQGESKELYEFVVNGTTYRYTSYSDNVTWNTFSWSRTTIERDGVKVASRFERNELTVRAEYAGIFSLMISQYTINPISITIRRFFSASESDVLVVFEGRVEEAIVKGRVVTMRCVQTGTELTREIPRFRGQSLCNNTLFDNLCGLVRATYKVTATATQSGNQLTSATFGGYTNGYFNQGIAYFGYDVRMITGHAGNVIGLHLPFSGFGSGSGSVDVYPGCDKTWQTCLSRFSNRDNFQGMPNMSNAPIALSLRSYH